MAINQTVRELAQFIYKLYKNNLLFVFTKDVLKLTF